MKVPIPILFLAHLLCARGSIADVTGVSGDTAAAQAEAQEHDGIRLFLDQIGRIVQTGDAGAYLAIMTDSASLDRARDFASTELMPGAGRVVVQERDRTGLAGSLPGNGYRLMVDTFAEVGSRARVATWRLDVKRVGESGADREWAIADQERVSSVENLYRVGLNPSRQFTARDLHIAVEDMDLTLADGSVFVADVDQGATALVLLGRGTMNFHPSPDTEKGQLKIFCGRETLDARFDAAFIRLNPGDFETTIAGSQLTERAVYPRELRRAQDVFREESPKTFGIDLADLSRDAWSLLPKTGDFVAEIRTRRFDTLTYAKSSSEAEDITLFDRKRHHNIALYASQDRLTGRGRFYNEDDLVDYDILNYDIDVTATPGRHWIDGFARVRLKVRTNGIATLTLRLADTLTVQSIISEEYGRLFGIRVNNQNLVVVNLPTVLARDAVVTLAISYAGRLEPKTPDRETVAVDQGAIVQDDVPVIVAEPSSLYGSGSYWYPQAPVSDYATATIRLSVPAAVDCVASGELEPGFPVLVPARDPTQNRKVYIFKALQPIRYLAFVMSRFTRTDTITVAFPPSAEDDIALTGLSYNSVRLSVEANPHQAKSGRELIERAADIAMFYQSLVGDSPYPSFTVALIESDLPGGQSPGYFAALNQPLPTSRLVWRNDPAAFSGYPDFFIAHEMAHQWWGQAVGWRNYHEQWLSEGFAQYFAALYAQHELGDQQFNSVLKQLRRWGVSASDQGPVSLGYRLGHIRNDSRVFRALVYNKGAAVLHTLRRLIGDEPFFRGLRRFYRASRFQKVGTEEFRVAMQQETGMSLDRFFERWIYGSTLPKLKFTWRLDGTHLLLHVEQIGDLFDVPVTITLQYLNQKPVDVIIPVTERTAEKRIPLAGTLRRLEINKADGTLANITEG